MKQTREPLVSVFSSGAVEEDDEIVEQAHTTHKVNGSIQKAESLRASLGQLKQKTSLSSFSLFFFLFFSQQTSPIKDQQWRA